jgi:polysaccharide pyruvyl transferase WcaK-like protein
VNIGAIGWWNYDNQGDLAMLAALRQGLAPHRVVAIDTGFLAHPDTIYRLNRLDYIMLGGGTLITGKPTAPFDSFDQWADQLDPPLGVAGLGVDSVSDAYWPAVEALLDRAQFFYVRDRESRHLLRDHPKVQVAPDLTFACPLPSRKGRSSGTSAAPVCGVNLRRSGWSDLDPGPWLEALRRLPVQVKGIPLSSFDVFDENGLLKELDPETPEHFESSLYHQVDLMIGTAFHSILFAIQAAVPVVAIGYAPKVCRFMVENGLERYLLAPDEHQRLPAVVDELLANGAEITATLLQIRDDLCRHARRNMDSMRAQVEESGRRHQRTGPRVTVAIVGSGDVEKDQRTLASCAAQTYEDVELLFVDADPRNDAPARLRQALQRSSGTYVSWIDGGDRLAEDAVDCLVGRLETQPHPDVVYADYYAMSSAHLPVGYHDVPGPEKLYRRDVVGPCFLVRRTLLPLLDEIDADTPLMAYHLWLQAGPKDRFLAFHAPLCYSSRPIGSRPFVAKERDVRRRWRRTQPLWKRTVWRVLDTDLGERLIVRPLARLLRLFGRRRNGQPH